MSVLVDQRKVAYVSVSEPLATAFGSNTRSFGRNATEYGGYTSFVQHRGSIPVMWHQEVNQMTPRPPIESKLARSHVMAQELNHQYRSSTHSILEQPNISMTYSVDMVHLSTSLTLSNAANRSREKASYWWSMAIVSVISINSYRRRIG